MPEPKDVFGQSSVVIPNLFNRSSQAFTKSSSGVNQHVIHTDVTTPLTYSEALVGGEWNTAGKSARKSKNIRADNNSKQNAPLKGGEKKNYDKRGKSKVLIGAGHSNSLARAARRFHYSVSKLRPETTVSNLKGHISSFLQCEDSAIDIEEISLKHNRYYRMFKVTVGEEYSKQMNDGKNWPSGVEIKRFFLPKVTKLPEESQKTPVRLIESCHELMDQTNTEGTVERLNPLVDAQ